jgi:DNA-binding response OmpR family regulator
MLLARHLAGIGIGAREGGRWPVRPGALRAHTAEIAVVLLDVMMPEMDGYQTLAAIKSDDDLRHVPVIMVTGVDELDSVAKCIEMGAADYLPKPFNAVILGARVRASMADKRLRDVELAHAAARPRCSKRSSARKLS